MLSGKKTYIAAALVGISAALEALGHGEYAKIVFGIGTALGLVGIRHAIPKAAPVAVLALCSLALGACATAPATQNAKESAGTSDVKIEAYSSQHDMRSMLPSKMTIEGDFNLTINNVGDDRVADIAQTNSGSTTATQAATATQTPTSSTETTPSATITPTGQ